jgi:hypothetical protein
LCTHMAVMDKNTVILLDLQVLLVPNVYKKN